MAKDLSAVAAKSTASESTTAVSLSTPIMDGQMDVDVDNGNFFNFFIFLIIITRRFFILRGNGR